MRAISEDEALPDEAATDRLAERLAPLARAGDVIALSGPLGAGKTRFARGFIAARARDARVPAPGEVPSPTFTLVQVYKLGEVPVWHFDLFRLTRPADVWELGLEEALAEGIALIEWPERIIGLLPADRLELRFEVGPAGARRCHLTGHGRWSERLAAA